MIINNVKSVSSVILLAIFCLLSSCKRDARRIKKSQEDEVDPKMFMQNILLADAKAQQSYDIIYKDTYVTWRGEMLLGLKKHEGTIQSSGGKLEVRGNQITKGEFIMDMNSFKCTDIEDPESNRRFVEHLKSDDFLNVEKFSLATFKIKNYVQNGDVIHVEGILNLRGYSRLIRFVATSHMENDEFRLVSDEFFIDRSRFAVSYNIEGTSIGESAKSRIIKNNVALRIHLRARKRKEPTEVKN